MKLHKLLQNNKGSSLIGAIIAMITLGAAAAAIATLSSTDSASTMDNTQLIQARAIANAALQDARYHLDYGQCPGGNQDFANGSYTIYSDPTTQTITAVAQVDDAKVTQSINVDYSFNCTDIEAGTAYLDNNIMQDITLIKTCNKQAIIDKIYMVWDWSECALAVNCDGSVTEPDLVYETNEEPPSGKFWICHVPPGNPENAQTLGVNMNGWLNGHSGGSGPNHNLDYLGPCLIQNPEAQDQEIITCEGTNESNEKLVFCTKDDNNSKITEISLANVTIYKIGEIPDGSAMPKSSAEEIDTANAVMVQNGEYLLDITLDDIIPPGAWWTLVVEFVDGSSLTEMFKIGTSPDPTVEIPSVNEGNDTPEEPVPSTPEGFEEEGGSVAVEQGHTLNLNVIGSAITCGPGGPEVDVRTQLCLNENCSQLWGNADVDGGESYSVAVNSANQNFSIVANASLESCANFNRTISSTNTVHVKTLTNGEAAPPLSGYGGQMSVQQFLVNYINAQGNVVLENNQVLMLFELGVDLSSNPANSAADFQDLVILMTINDLE